MAAQCHTAAVPAAPLPQPYALLHSVARCLCPPHFNGYFAERERERVWEGQLLGEQRRLCMAHVITIGRMEMSLLYHESVSMSLEKQSERK